MLDRLEQKGWVSRSRRAQDRRVQHLDLTTAGNAIRSMTVPIIASALREIAAPFRASEIAVASRVLNALTNTAIAHTIERC
jgi:DNA-binding MarR family transcriptional regulator